MTHKPRRRAAAGLIDRRSFLLYGIASLAARNVDASPNPSPSHAFVDEIQCLEVTHGGRLGVALLPISERRPLGYRIDERFGMCSTFKLPLVAMVLRHAQDGGLSLDTPVVYTAEDIVPYSPITQGNLDKGQMTIAELAKAAQMNSDNTAANLLLSLIDGPRGFTARVRQMGDALTRLDRYEPAMNLVPPGEVRDTTSPAAMTKTVEHIVFTEFLSEINKQTLSQWMQQTTTGRARLRAGFPGNWLAGDKTGTGLAETMPTRFNDVAVVWPSEENDGFVLSAYYESGGPFGEFRREEESVLRAVGQAAARYFAATYDVKPAS
ncbi:MAG: class A beta-lactamase [Pseudomonadota bacterium]